MGTVRSESAIVPFFKIDGFLYKSGPKTFSLKNKNFVLKGSQGEALPPYLKASRKV